MGASSPGRARAVTALALFVTALGACDLPRVIDPFPIRVERVGGAVVAAADLGDGPIPVVIDVLSPLTLVDASVDQPPRRRRVALTLVGEDPGGAFTVPRIRFPDADILDLSVCGAANGTCVVGIDGDVRDVSGVVGVDVMGGNSLRLDFPTNQLFLFPDIAGTNSQRTTECDAVMTTVFAGGGTVSVAGAEVPYGASRPTVGACLAPDAVDAPDSTPPGAIGTDALMALSTGVGQSIVSVSAYDRYARRSGAPLAAALPRTVLHLPSGDLDVGAGELPGMALVGNLGTESAQRGPCRELYLNRLMAEDRCRLDGISPCPCPDGAQFCAAASAVELDRPIAVAVVADEDPLLQRLRDEFRPALPELDGIIAADAMASLRLDLDYANDRLLMSCQDPAACDTRPAVVSRAALPAIAACRAVAVPVDAGVADAADAAAVDAGTADAAVP